MKGLFRGAGAADLDAALRLLGSEEKAMVRLTREGRVIALTDRAEALLGLSPLHLIFESLSALHREMLREAIARGEACRFTECFCGRRFYDVSVAPTEEGALLLIEPREKQTLLDAKIQGDVRGSLQGILSAAYMVRDEKPGLYEKITKRVYQIERTLDHAEILMQSSDFQTQPQLAEHDLPALCRRAAEAFMNAGGPPVEVRAPDRMPATFDASMLMRALLNLMTNAAMTTQIWISVTHQPENNPCTGGVFLISVEDNGEGVPMEELQELYSSWREVVNRRRYPIIYEGKTRPGTGIPVVALIAEYHKGRLLFEERPAGGARFCLSFPDNLMPESFVVECGSERDDIRIIRNELSVLGDRDSS